MISRCIEKRLQALVVFIKSLVILLSLAPIAIGSATLNNYMSIIVFLVFMSAIMYLISKFSKNELDPQNHEYCSGKNMKKALVDFAPQKTVSLGACRIWEIIRISGSYKNNLSATFCALILSLALLFYGVHKTGINHAMFIVLGLLIFFGVILHLWSIMLPIWASALYHLGQGWLSGRDMYFEIFDIIGFYFLLGFCCDVLAFMAQRFKNQSKRPTPLCNETTP